MRKYTIFAILLLSIFSITDKQSLSFGLFDYNSYDKSGNYTFQVEDNTFHDDEGKDGERSEDDKYIKFAKIGERTKAIEFPMKIFYLGLDINWIATRFGMTNGVDNKAVFKGSFFRRFQDIDVHIGWRFHKNVAVEVGYLYFGNIRNIQNLATTIHGAYIDIIGYTPFIDLKYTTLEFYGSIGGFYGSSSKSYKASFGGAKFGAGIQAKIYGPTALRVGIDYYYPFDKQIAKSGLLTFKTGFQIYFNFFN